MFLIDVLDQTLVFRLQWEAQSGMNITGMNIKRELNKGPTSENAPLASDRDTFERSCAHWSEAGREGMDEFYTFATIDYHYLANLIDWPALLSFLANSNGELDLADIACGSGKFPSALLNHTDIRKELGSTDVSLSVHYDLLDPSPFAIEEASLVLREPFVPRNQFCCKLQDWRPSPEGYDIAWAMHALYCVPAAELGHCLSIWHRALRPGAIGIIAQSNRSGHYISFYDHFIESMRDGNGTPFSAAEDVEQALNDAGFEQQSRVLQYETIIDEANTQSLEAYLQRCAFDDSALLSDMLSGGSLANYLAGAKRDGAYRFQQSVRVFVFGTDLTSFDFWKKPNV